MNNNKRNRILKDGTNKQVLWLFIEEDLQLREEIQSYLDEHQKIAAIKCLKAYIENEVYSITYKYDITSTYKKSTLREIKDTIDRYAIRYNIIKKIKQLRERIEQWCELHGYDNMSYQKEIKDNKTGEYTYRYSDWSMVDDHYGLMVNDYEWLPSKKLYNEYNKLWKHYKK